MEITEGKEGRKEEEKGGKMGEDWKGEEGKGGKGEVIQVLERLPPGAEGDGRPCITDGSTKSLLLLRRMVKLQQV